jgi:hypothetical protein
VTWAAVGPVLGGVVGVPVGLEELVVVGGLVVVVSVGVPEVVVEEVVDVGVRGLAVVVDEVGGCG